MGRVVFRVGRVPGDEELAAGGLVVGGDVEEVVVLGVGVEVEAAGGEGGAEEGVDGGEVGGGEGGDGVGHWEGWQRTGVGHRCGF